MSDEQRQRPEEGEPVSPRRERKGQMAARLSSLAGSVMDLHVRIALQEADREKRRLISGLLLLSGGLALLTLALVAAEAALLITVRNRWGLGWAEASLVVAGLDLLLAGGFLRWGGALLKGPYLPQTLSGLRRTLRAIQGR
ncbi:MAG: phage holin family protein [Cyanobacteriota bacterium]